MSDQQDEEILRRRAREQAEIERQTDALVLRTLTTLVTASEELKTKLRRDTESLLEGYRRNKRQLENEISLTTAERLRSRREAEQEKATIIAEARVQAREIVEAAKRERETMLAEARAMEQRLRSLEDQIRSVFGTGIPGFEPRPDLPSPEARPIADPLLPDVPDMAGPLAPASPFIPASPLVLNQLAEAPAPTAPAPTAPAPATADDLSPEIGPTLTEPEEPVAHRPAEPSPDAPAADDALPEDVADRLNLPSASAPRAAPTQPPSPAAAPNPVASFIPSSPAPAPDRPARPLPFPARAYSQQAASARRRPVELFFDGVPGYQQASALERAVNDLLPDEEIDILRFERGQLVLGLQAADLGRLADQLVAGSPASLELEGVAGDRATFRCI